MTNKEIWRQPVLSAAMFQLLLTLMVGWLIVMSQATSLAAGYFTDHDAWLLVAGGALLVNMSWWPLRGAPVPVLTRSQLYACCSGIALVAYASSFLVFHHYPVSRDEESATFAANYFAAGRLGWPIPASLHNLAQAAIPMHINVRPGAWLSNYLPINAAFRALIGQLGDQWLAGPLLLLAGAVALASAARHIWPSRSHAATVAVTMALTSTQIVVNAATPFATTGHFALNAIWLACFLRSGRRGHAAAIIVGFFASGLHQSHFHIGFVMAFVVWMVMERRFRLAAVYVLACLFYWFVWHHAWPWFLDVTMGKQISVSGTPPPPGANAILWRLSQFQIGESLTRFIAWQNVLLLPLAIAGVGASWRATGQERILIGCSLACSLGLVTLVLQDHGYGYRYLHHLIPCFCLLAAGGWIAVEERMGQRLPVSILVASVAFAAAFTLPIVTWRIIIANSPYERAYAAARSAKTDYLLIDTRGGAYLQNIIRYKEGNVPVLLDLGAVPGRELARICKTSRVMLFDENQARFFGIVKNPDMMLNANESFNRKKQLGYLNCGIPMPI